MIKCKRASIRQVFYTERIHQEFASAEELNRAESREGESQFSSRRRTTFHSRKNVQISSTPFGIDGNWEKQRNLGYVSLRRVARVESASGKSRNRERISFVWELDAARFYIPRLSLCPLKLEISRDIKFCSRE